MTGVEWVLLSLVLTCGFYAAWNIGAAQAAERVDHSAKFGNIVVEERK